MNTYLYGDNHGGWKHITESVLRDRPDAIVLLGDLGTTQPLEAHLAPILSKTAVWWIPGNHDSESDFEYQNVFGSALADRNLHGRVVDISGVRVAGLGGVFRGTIWHPEQGDPAFENYQDYCRHLKSTRPFRLRHVLPDNNQLAVQLGKERVHTTSIFPDVYYQLAAQEADVLVVHEAPSCHPNGFAAIDELARALGVKTVFHGHHHVSFDYESEAELGFETYGVGLCGVTDLQGEIVRAGDLDETRQRKVLAHKREKPGSR